MKLNKLINKAISNTQHGLMEAFRVLAHACRTAATAPEMGINSGPEGSPDESESTESSEYFNRSEEASLQYIADHESSDDALPSEFQVNEYSSSDEYEENPPLHSHISHSIFSLMKSSALRKNHPSNTQPSPR